MALLTVEFLEAKSLYMSKPNHVCILGCGRSGTSIFGELFQSVPGYSYYSEPLLSEVSGLDFSNPLAIKVPRPDTGAHTSMGLPFLWPQFLELFPTPPVIFWQVRHPLDTICSLKVGIAKNWGHHPRPPQWEQWLHRPLIERGAYHWNFLNTASYNQIKAHVVVSRFEEMLKDPFGHAKRCLQAAGADINAFTREAELWAFRVQDQNNDHFSEAECSKPYSTGDHLKKVGRWHENLSPSQLKQVLPLIEEGAREFKYPLPQ